MSLLTIGVSCMIQQEPPRNLPYLDAHGWRVAMCRDLRALKRGYTLLILCLSHYFRCRRLREIYVLNLGRRHFECIVEYVLTTKTRT